MGYYIYAWFEDYNPQLQIIDAQSGSVCVNWRYHDRKQGFLSDKKELQRLFRDLLLLTCKQEMNNCRLFHVTPFPRQLTNSRPLNLVTKEPIDKLA